jgi:GGDEF domain-containing protein
MPDLPSRRNALDPPPPLRDGLGTALAARDAELAKEWVLALIAGSALEDAARLPLERLARDGPGACGAVARSLADDEELARLASGQLPALAAAAGGGAGAGGAVKAVAALHRVVWHAARREELARAGAARVARAAARLAHVCAVAAEAAATVATQPAGVELRVRDLRVGRGADAVEAVREAVVLGEPFALLVVEVDDVDRMLSGQHGDEVDAALHRAGAALAQELAGTDTVVAERPGEWHVVAPGADAVRLARRLAAAVGGSETQAGPFLRVSVGAAAFPGDASDAAALHACARRRAYAALAAGTAIIASEEPPA